MIPNSPKGLMSVYDVYHDVQGYVPNYWDWRNGKGWPSFFPKSERPSLELLVKLEKSKPEWADFSDPYSHVDYLQDISQAAWKLTQTIVRNVGEIIVIKDGNEISMDPSAMCDMADFPVTPWGDMTNGVVNWSDTAFNKIIPTDLGQRATWQGWIADLEGGRIYLQADKTKKIIAQTIKDGQKQGGQKLSATQTLAKNFKPLTYKELGTLWPARAKRCL